MEDATNGNDNEVHIIDRKLICGTYKCEYADDTRIPFFQRIFSKCDFLCVQEHGLFKSQLGWFYKIERGLGKHGVSAMDENIALKGRPHGGVAILWKSTLSIKVMPLECDSKRVCAVLINLARNVKMLLVSVYMPCDDRRPDGNLTEYIDTLNEIDIICNSVQVDLVCIGGDLNTDLSRNTHQTYELINYVSEHGYSFCVDDPCSAVEYTCCSKGSGIRSLIDHFILSDNTMSGLHEYECIDAVENFSDHVAIMCTLDYAVQYCKSTEPAQKFISLPAWHKVTEADVHNYHLLLSDKLRKIHILCEVLACVDPNCSMHTKEICTFYDNITLALISACNESIRLLSLPEANLCLVGMIM